MGGAADVCVRKGRAIAFSALLPSIPFVHGHHLVLPFLLLNRLSSCRETLVRFAVRSIRAGPRFALLQIDSKGQKFPFHPGPG